MNEKFDDGNIIFQKTVNILKNDTAYTLYNKLINIAVSNFDKVYDLVLNKRYEGKPQKGKSTYFPRQVPYGGFIDENWSLDKIERFGSMLKNLSIPHNEIYKTTSHKVLKNKWAYMEDPIR